MNSKPRGPVETIERLSVKIKIYSGTHHGKTSYLVAYHADGKRVRDRAPTLEAARSLAKAKVRDLTDGTAHVGTFTPQQVAVINEAVDTLKGINIKLSTVAREFAEAHAILKGKSIIDAARHYAAYLAHAEKAGAPVTLSKVVTEFLAEIEAKGRSFRYVEDCTSRLTRASKAIDANIADITKDDLAAWLKSIKATGRNFNNYRSALRTLFTYARDAGYLPEDARTAPEKIILDDDKGGKIGIYTPDQLSKMLAGLEERFLPLVALGAFAGLRTAEIHRLEWQDIDFAEGHIVVGKEKAKTAQRRIVPMLSAFRAWVEPLAKKTGHVIPQYSRDAVMLRVYGAALDKVKVPSIHNGLRHSFASYRLAAVPNAAQVSLEMGNSPKKLFTNYRELVTAKQAEKWFSVMPESKEKVISISEAA